MSTPAIRASGLSKKYRIGYLQQRHDTLRDAIMARLKPRRTADQPDATIWALKDVSFEIPRGEAVGIIGRNGAGKSTLLKILSRITRPTLGWVDVFGRVGSLLEVGTGFHHELSGRENIFLNGAILGMQKKVIEQKFDEIVAFSEVGKFIDTPVKHYSSGMYMRLAFAVAAYLEPEILLVDEVLAVGDAAFQKKCLGKMGQVASEGRTVLFVSHNMPAIASLTHSCLWLDRGQVAEYGPTAEVVRRYLDQALATGERTGEVDLLTHPRTRSLPREVEFSSLRLINQEGQPASAFAEGEPLRAEIRLRLNKPVQMFEISLRVLTVDGFAVFAMHYPKQTVDLEEGRYCITAAFDPNLLRPGKYQIELACQSNLLQDEIGDAFLFNIDHHPEGEDDFFWNADNRGVVRLGYTWGSLAREN